MPESVAATGPSDIDAISARINYPTGVEVRIEGGWFESGAPFHMGFRAQAEHALLELGADGLFLEDKDGRQKLDPPPGDAYDAEIGYFIGCCQTGKWPDRCPAGAIRPGTRIGIIAEGIPVTKRRDAHMLGLEEFEIGLMFWAKDNARETLAEVKQFGIRAGQLGFPGELTLDGAAEKWDAALTAERFTAVTAVCSYVGEDYKDIPTVERTVGLVPEGTRAERIARTKAVSDVSRKLAIDSVACHIGFVSHDFGSRSYAAIRDVVRDIMRPLRKERAVFHAGDRPRAGQGAFAIHRGCKAPESQNQFRPGQHDFVRDGRSD